MEESQLQVIINDFRAIKKAEIDLNGITVIAGENGSGKSTISKLAYHSFKIASHFDEYVDDKSGYEVRGYIMKLHSLGVELLEDKEWDELSGLVVQANNSNNFAMVTKILEFLRSSIDERKLDERYLYRAKRVLSRVGDGHQGETLNELFGSIKSEINSLVNTVTSIKKERMNSVYFENILSHFKDFDRRNFDIKEFGTQIITEGRLLPVHSVEKVFYIDSPMMLDDSTSHIPHWYDLHTFIRHNSHKNVSNGIGGILQEEIIKGNVSLEESGYNQYTYTRKDGKVFDLLNCATGLKSFSILQMLGKAGAFDKNTLLIIDEPEAHLHPQWVVEYARVIVLLNKTLGVRFLIASHHPDMISALKYISQEEGVEAGLNYYLAKRHKKSYSYNYKELGHNIEEIFSSFNIALDRIEEYGRED